MKTLSIVMSLLFAMIFIPDVHAQYCNNDYDYEYYYNNNGYYGHHYKHRYNKRRRHYRDRLSIKSFERRIEDGIRTGELTRRERRKLIRELNRLMDYRDHILRDGYVSRYERKRFEKKKIKLDRMIFDKKHNRFRRY